MDPGSLLFVTVLAISTITPEQGADKALLSAYLKQSGIESRVKSQAKKLERKYVSRDVKFFVGYGALITKSIVEQKITFRWGF